MTPLDPTDILRRLFSNPQISLGDLVYAARDREGLGWDGPAVKAWSDAVVDAERWLKEHPPGSSS